MYEIKGKYNVAKVFATTIEESCKKQIEEMCNQKWLEKCNIAIMADCHTGAGCTIGTTIQLQNKVSPSLVGVDISCGMLCIEIHNQLKLNLEKIDNFINTNIPTGFDVNEEEQYPNYLLDDLLKRLHCYKQIKDIDRVKKSCESLGSGNHFIEINVSKNNIHYLVIHSGSRNLGKQGAAIYQEIADEYCNHTKKDRLKERTQLIKKLKEQGRYQEIQNELKKFDVEYKIEKKIPRNLCYLENEDMRNYLEDTLICNEYAKLSRMSIAKRILDFIVKDNFQKLNNEVNFKANETNLKTSLENIHGNLYEYSYKFNGLVRKSLFWKYVK